MENTTHQGVYFAPEAYAGFWLRVSAWAIDLLFLLLLSYGYWLIFYYYSQWTMFELNLLTGSIFFTWMIYLTVIKSSRKSTIGFLLTGIKIVDLQGDKPSLWRMTFRFLLLSIGPFELLNDLIWLTGEKTKQTLRDKFSGTYVVRKTAQPIGNAKIVMTRLFVLGWNLIYKEVAIPEKVFEN